MNYITLNNRRNGLSNFRHGFDRLFDEFWNTPSNVWNLKEMDTQWVPTCDVELENNHYLISLEAAGVPKDQIKVEFNDNQIIISGERREENQKKEGKERYTERKFGKFQRSFTLPSDINPDKVEAHYQDGVLKVYIPKAEATTPRQIQIGNGKAA